MKTFYHTTCPQFHDTRAIAKAKWLQNEAGNGNGNRGDRTVVYHNQELSAHDTKLDVLEKILQAACDAPVTPETPDVLTGLLAYWKMDEGSSLAIRQDSHTGNHDLTPLGQAQVIAGRISNGAYCFGSPGNELNNSDAVFGLTGTYTIVGWINVRTGSSGAGMFLMGKQDKDSSSGFVFPTEGYMLYINSSGLFALWQGNGVSTTEVADNEGFDINVWNFIVCGFDGTNQFIQINDGVRTVGAGVVPTVGSKPFGFGGTKGMVLDGCVAYFDEFGVYNRVLTEAEASYLFNFSNGMTYPFTL